MAERSDDIINYKKGKLTPKEMHALEKKALSDPFLSEALDGLEEVPGDEVASDVADLQQRISAKKQRSFPWMRIAAGIAIMLGAGWLTLSFWPREEKLALQPAVTTDSVASSTLPTAVAPIERKPTAPPAASVQQPATHSNTLKSSEESDLAKSARNLAHTPIADEAKPGKDQAAVAPTSELITSTETEKAKAAEPEARTNAADLAESSKAAPVMAKKEVATAAGAARSQVAVAHVSGRVIAGEDGAPIPGVNVLVKGTSNGTVTDAQGNYKLEVPVGTKLQFSFIGYDTKELTVSADGTPDVTLTADNTQLSEVVVTGLGVKKDDDEEHEPVVRLANPEGGRRGYNRYLENSLRYPVEALTYNIKGKVTIEFTVQANGILGDFRVLKSLGHGCDEEVIRLVKEGPKWSPTTEDNVAVESTVRVRVKFDPAKAKK